MRHTLRRLFRCSQGRHREALDMERWALKPCAPPTMVIYTLRWRCVDCGDTRWLADSDNIEEERKAGRIT